MIDQIRDDFNGAALGPAWKVTGVATVAGGQLSFNASAAFGDNRAALYLDGAQATGRAFARRAGLYSEWEIVSGTAEASKTGPYFGFGAGVGNQNATLSSGAGGVGKAGIVAGIDTDASSNINLIRLGSRSSPKVPVLRLAASTTYRVRLVCGHESVSTIKENVNFKRARGFAILIQGGAYGAIGSGQWHVAWWEQDGGVYGVNVDDPLWLIASNGTSATNKHKFNYVKVGAMSVPLLRCAEDFDQTSDALLRGGATLLFDLLGKPWLHPKQGITRSGGNAIPDGTSGDQISLLNADTANGFIRLAFQVVSKTLNHEQWMYFRYKDASNWWRFGGIGNGAGSVSLHLQRCLAGAVTNPALDDGVANPTLTYALADEDKGKIALLGSRIVAFVNDTRVMSLVDASNSDGTRHGLGFNATTTAIAGDNFTFCPGVAI